MSEITHAKLLDEVLHHKPLASPPERHDRSAPHIEPGNHPSLQGFVTRC